MLASEVRKGSAEVLILGAIEERPRHGYEIARIIELRSGGAIVFHSATLYPTLHRLEQRRLVAGRWVEKAGERRRRYYRITAAGRVVLRDQRRSWRAFVDALTRAARIRET
jgi:DNA-binding PadR family transcriptional regulator